EQVTLPRRLRSRHAALVHSPDSFLPLRRPCPGVVTIHDLAFEEIAGEMAGRTRWKYRTFLARAARSAERVICPSRFTADDVIAPSLYEGFGLVVLDAMARGCPVICARAGALPDTGGTAAAYFDPGDAADLAAALLRVVADAAEREQLAALGMARAADFS